MRYRCHQTFQAFSCWALARRPAPVVAQYRSRRGWTEPLNAFLAVALDSGEREPPSYRDTLAPLEEREQEPAPAAAPDIEATRVAWEVMNSRTRQRTAWRFSSVDIPALLDTLKTKESPFTVNGDWLRLVPGSRITPELAQALREHKAEVLEYLRPGNETTSPFDLPFPIGYGGLPKTQVELAELVDDRFGISDPVHRRNNVVSWVRGHLQDRRESHGEHYDALKREQQRLGRILDRQAHNRWKI